MTLQEFKKTHPDVVIGFGYSSAHSGASNGDAGPTIEESHLMQHYFEGGVSLCGIWLRPDNGNQVGNAIENICPGCQDGLDTWDEWN